MVLAKVEVSGSFWAEQPFVAVGRQEVDGQEVDGQEVDGEEDHVPQVERRPQVGGQEGLRLIFMPGRRRLDAELVRRGLVETRAAAHEAITAHRVTVSGAIALKPARLVDPAEPVQLLRPPRRFVSRGGEKLEIKGFERRV